MNMQQNPFNTKHLIFQVDTDKIVKSILSSDWKKKGINLNTLAMDNTVIYSHDAVSKKDKVEKFTVEISKFQSVFFSIIPADLTTRHRLYFTEFNIIDGPKGPIKNTNVGFVLNSEHADHYMPKDSKEANYTMTIRINFLDNDGNKCIQDFTIDPKLKIRQTEGGGG